MKQLQRLTDSLKALISRNVHLARLCVICLVVLIIMLVSVGNPAKFLSAANLRSMMMQMPELGILTLAVTFALFLGGIDLSVVSIANLSGIVSAMLSVQLTASGMEPSTAVAISMLVALVVGLVCGLINGLVVSSFGVPAILATLGTMELYKGIGLIISNGSAITGLPSAYGTIGSKLIFGIPLIMVIFVLAVIVVAIVMQHRKFGLDIYLLGTNSKAAEFSGINTSVVTVKAFVCSGLLAATAGIIIASRVMTAKADYGSSYILQCLLVAILGGISPFGGFGKVTGILVALFTLQMLSSGFNMMRLSSYQKLAIWGAVLIAVMVMNFLLERHRERQSIKQCIQKNIVESQMQE